MTLSGKNLIGGEGVGNGTRSFQSINPSTGDKLPTVFHEALNGEIDIACKLAEECAGEYRQRSGEKKASFLYAIAAEIEALGDQLIEICVAETGLPAGRIINERGRTIGQLKLFANLLLEGSWVNASIDSKIADRQPTPRPDIRSMEIGIGPVAVFGASNFPLAFSVCGGDTVSALAAGCPVIVKAHQAHAGTSELVGRAIQKAVAVCNLPAGVFSMLHGGISVGSSLVLHPAVKAVGFTGSFKGGKEIFDLAVSRPEPIPVYAEMGSTNPVFMLPDIIAKDAMNLASRFTASVNLGVGQFCTNPGLLIIESPSFIPILKEAFVKSSGGIALTPGIQQMYKSKVDSLLSVKNVELMASGETIEGFTAICPYLFVVSGKDFLQTPHLAEEIFGPVSIVVLAEDADEMQTIAKSLAGHLTATVFGDDEELSDASPLLQTLQNKAGRIIINEFPTGVEVCYSMVHGGPYPATTYPASTSVGTSAIYRFTRAVCFQGFPQSLLPKELQDSNPLGIWRRLDGDLKK